MPAYWELIAYRVDSTALQALVGSKEKFPLAKILKSGTAKDMADDDRLDETDGLRGALEQIAAGGRALDQENAGAYRIALEAILANTAIEIGRGEGYADRERIPEALRKLGLRTYAKAFEGCEPRFPWPKSRGDADWPWATFLDRTTLEKIAREITALLAGAESAGRLLWKSKVTKKKRTLLIELTGGGGGDGKKYALVTKKDGVLATGSFDDVLASVPTQDFEEAAMSLKKGGGQKILAPDLLDDDAARIKETLVAKMKLEEYDEDIVDLVLDIIDFVSLFESVKGKLAATDGIMLFADGEQ